MGIWTGEVEVIKVQGAVFDPQTPPPPIPPQKKLIMVIYDPSTLEAEEIGRSLRPTGM